MGFYSGFILFAVMVVVPLVVAARLRDLTAEVRALRARLDALERGPGATPPPPPLTHQAPAVAPATTPVGAFHTPPPPPPAPAAPIDAPRPRPGFEQLLGGIWLQNVGAVILLLGLFFMVVWGYTTGRFGAGVLVGAGVALGAVFAWRGDRTARQVPDFGHTLIGIGLGVIYLSLYLGHFTLRVLPPLPAFALLALVSLGSVGVGLRYRVPAIAALGVIGAFVPQLMAIWVPLRGFSMTPPGMLSWLAFVNAVVFVLAARAGWSGLNLAALLLSAFVWMGAFPKPSWGWGTQVSLGVLFAATGLAPVWRLARRPGRAPGMDLAVIAAAPLALIVASWPFLDRVPPVVAAIYLIVLAILYVGVALAVDSGREDEDLWRPLTGAATVFLAAAVQRAAGPTYAPMAWCVEGLVLLGLGMHRPGAWLRVSGSAVAALGAIWALVHTNTIRVFPRPTFGDFALANVDDLVCIAAVLAGAMVLARGRERLTTAERLLPEAWGAAGNLMLAAWMGREARHVAVLYGREGPAFVHALRAFAWLAQAGSLLMRNLRSGRGFYRVCAYVLAAFALLTLVGTLSLSTPFGWTASLGLATVVLVLVLAARLAARRSALTVQERRMPEIWTAAGNALLLLWTAREARPIAVALEQAMHGWSAGTIVEYSRLRTLTPVVASAGWLLQAIALVLAGWLRDSPFLRWTGLAVFGLTVLKFLVFDLQTVDVFWRFLTAIVVGSCLLAVSYAYQRRNRGAPAGAQPGADRPA